jgi:hypothetical protein
VAAAADDVDALEEIAVDATTWENAAHRPDARGRNWQLGKPLRELQVAFRSLGISSSIDTLDRARLWLNAAGFAA